MTVKELMDNGYVEADTTWQRGYVSRKQDPMAAVIRVAGGARSGEYYALMPSGKSTQYCLRQYYRKGA